MDDLIYAAIFDVASQYCAPPKDFGKRLMDPRTDLGARLQDFIAGKDISGPQMGRDDICLSVMRVAAEYDVSPYHVAAVLWRGMRGEPSLALAKLHALMREMGLTPKQLVELAQVIAAYP